MTAHDRQHELVERYRAIDDPQERLAAIVDRARQLPSFPPADRTETHRVHGCGSRAWVIGDCRNGLCRFRADADSPVVRGLLVLLCETYDGVPPAEVVTTEPSLLEELGLTRSLSPTRVNGLRIVRERIRALAAEHLPSRPARG